MIGVTGKVNPFVIHDAGTSMFDELVLVNVPGVESKLLTMVSKRTQEHMEEKFQDRLITKQVEQGATLHSYAKAVEELLCCHFDSNVVL